MQAFGRQRLDSFSVSCRPWEAFFVENDIPWSWANIVLHCDAFVTTKCPEVHILDASWNARNVGASSFSRQNNMFQSRRDGSQVYDELGGVSNLLEISFNTFVDLCP